MATPPKPTSPYPHLNISENLADAVKSLSKEEWSRFFKSIEIARLESIKSCADSDLTTERGKLTMISELQGIFLAIHQHRNIPQQQEE